jgi:hypothetical protein
MGRPALSLHAPGSVAALGDDALVSLPIMAAWRDGDQALWSLRPLRPARASTSG